MNTITGKIMPAVLVVDDDPVCRLFCVQTLAASGYRTFTASNGDSAIQTALRERPQVILTDIHLPDMSGAAAMARLLKLWPDAKTAPRLIAVSGDDSTQLHSALQTAGFAAVLIKPFVIETLLACMQIVENKLPEDGKTQVRRNGPEDSSFTPDPQRLPELQLQDVFRSELDQQLFKLDRAITKLDWKQATEILHRLSGAAALAGYPAFARCGRLLLAQLQQPQEIAGLADTYLDFLRQAADLLADRLLRPDSGFRHGK